MKVRYVLERMLAVGLASFTLFTSVPVQAEELLTGTNEESDTDEVAYEEGQLLVCVQGGSDALKEELGTSVGYRFRSLFGASGSETLSGGYTVDDTLMELPDNVELEECATDSDEYYDAVKADALEGTDAEEVSNAPKLLALTAAAEEDSEESSDCDIVLLNCTKDVEQAVAELTELDCVLWAEPDYLVEAVDDTHTYTVDDPYYSEQWGMDDIGLRDALDAGSYSPATGIDAPVVAVVDSGVDYTHPDLEDRMWSDGTSYSALTALGGGAYGINTSGDGNATSNPMDYDNGHGTHCAGVIAATINNATGVAGVNGASAKIMSCRFLTATTAPISGFIKAYDYIITAKECGVNVTTASNSWAMTAISAQISYAVNAAITKAGQHGIVSVFAAGNDGANLDVETAKREVPLSNPYMLRVGAATNEHTSSAFSNYGRTSVDLYAPGVQILSTTASSHEQYLPWLDNTAGSVYYTDFSSMPTDWGVAAQLLDSSVTDVSSSVSGGKLTAYLSAVDLSSGDVAAVWLKIPETEFDKDQYQKYLAIRAKLNDVTLAGEFTQPINKTATSLVGLSTSAEFTNGDGTIILSLPMVGDLTACDGYYYIGLYLPIDSVGDSPSIEFDDFGIGATPIRYAYMSGTSMACPAVSGAASVLAGKSGSEDGETAIEIISAIKGSVTTYSALADKCVTGGVLNLKDAYDAYDGSSTSGDKLRPVLTSATYEASGDSLKITLKGKYFGTTAGSVAVENVAGTVVSWSANQIVFTLPLTGAEYLGEFVVTRADGKTGRGFFSVAEDSLGFDSLAVPDYSYGDGAYTNEDLSGALAASTANGLYIYYEYSGDGSGAYETIDRYDYATGTWSNIDTSSLATLDSTADYWYSMAGGEDELYLLYVDEDVTAHLATWSEEKEEFIYDVAVDLDINHYMPSLCVYDGRLTAIITGDPSNEYAYQICPKTGKLLGTMTAPQVEMGIRYVASVVDDRLLLSDGIYNFSSAKSCPVYYDNGQWMYNEATWDIYDDTKDITDDNEFPYGSHLAMTDQGFICVGRSTGSGTSSYKDTYVLSGDLEDWEARSDIRFSTYNVARMAGCCHDDTTYCFAKDARTGKNMFKSLDLSKVDMSYTDNLQNAEKIDETDSLLFEYDGSEWTYDDTDLDEVESGSQLVFRNSSSADTIVTIYGLKEGTEGVVELQELELDGLSTIEYVLGDDFGPYKVEVERDGTGLKLTLLTIISGKVTIEGDTYVGQTLTAKYVSNRTGEQVTYQWYRDNKPIDGATNDTYELTTEDVGSYITVEVSGTNENNEGYAGSVKATTDSEITSSYDPDKKDDKDKKKHNDMPDWNIWDKIIGPASTSKTKTTVEETDPAPAASSNIAYYNAVAANLKATEAGNKALKNAIATGNETAVVRYDHVVGLTAATLKTLSQHPNMTIVVLYTNKQGAEMQIIIKGSAVKLTDGVNWYDLAMLTQLYGSTPVTTAGASTVPVVTTGTK